MTQSDIAPIIAYVQANLASAQSQVAQYQQAISDTQGLLNTALALEASATQQLQILQTLQASLPASTAQTI